MLTFITIGYNKRYKIIKSKSNKSQQLKYWPVDSLNCFSPSTIKNFMHLKSNKLKWNKLRRKIIKIRECIITSKMCALNTEI